MTPEERRTLNNITAGFFSSFTIAITVDSIGLHKQYDAKQCLNQHIGTVSHYNVCVCVFFLKNLKERGPDKVVAFLRHIMESLVNACNFLGLAWLGSLVPVRFFVSPFQM